MGFGRFGSIGGGSLELFSDMPRIIDTAPEQKIKKPLGPGSLAGVQIETVAEED